VTGSMVGVEALASWGGGVKEGQDIPKKGETGGKFEFELQGKIPGEGARED